MAIPYNIPSIRGDDAIQTYQLQSALMRQRQPSSKGQLAKALMQQGASTAPVDHWLQGLARVAQSMAGAYLNKEEEREGKQADEQMLAQMIGDKGQRQAAEAAQLAQAGVPGFQMPMPNPEPGKAYEMPTAPAGGGPEVVPQGMLQPAPTPAAKPVDASLVAALMRMGAEGNQTAAQAAPAFQFQYQDQQLREREARQEALAAAREARMLAAQNRETFGAPITVAGPDGKPALVQIGSNGTVRPLQGGYQPPSEKPPTPNDTERLLAASGLQPGTPEYQEMARQLLEGKARGQTTNITMPPQTQTGPIPPGFQLRAGADGALRMEPIPGGPADKKATGEQKKEDLRDAATARSGNIVIEDIDRIGRLLDTAILPATGVGATTLAGIPGTASHDVSKLLDGLKGNIAFDKLQQMREASPTGGALGAVSDRELALLQSVFGSLEQSQSTQQFKQNMQRLKTVYLDIVHGVGKWKDAPSGATETPLSGPGGGDRPPLSSFAR